MQPSRSRPVVATIASLLLSGVSGCGGGNGDALTGPDTAGEHTAASIVAITGTGQSVAPGRAVLTAPVVRVMSERGRPLQGATLSLVVENGRGWLEATSIVTDAGGEATLPRWVAPLTAGDFAVNVSAAGQGGTSVTARLSATVADEATALGTHVVGASGGTVTLTAPPVSGLEIIVPPGALTRPTTFSIASGPAPALPADLTLASPLIGIGAENTVSDSVVSIRIPATGTASAGVTLRAFALAADNGLVPLPTISSDASSITVGLSDFSGAATAALSSEASPSAPTAPSVLPGFGIRILAAFWSIPTTGVFQTGFSPGRDNVEFINRGSYTAVRGYCAGSTALSGGWFRWKSGVAQLTARAQFPGLLTRAETGDWPATDQLNPAIKLATALQKAYGPLDNNIGAWKAFFLKQNDRAVWENVLFQIRFSSQPVFLAVLSADRTEGHAVLAYKVDAGSGQIFVSDPNYPESAARVIQWNFGTFLPFMASPNADAPNNTAYTKFADASYMFWEYRNAINTTIDRYLTDGLVGQYPRATAYVTLKSGQLVAANGVSNVVNVESRDDQLRLTVTNIGAGIAHIINATNSSKTDVAGLAIPSNNTEIVLPLEVGQNRIGLVLKRTQTAAPAGTKWWDTKLLIVNRAQPVLRFLTQPAGAQVNSSLGAVRIGLVDEDGTLVPGVRSLDVTLMGGTAGAVLTGGGTVSTGADGSVTLAGLSVDRAGSGYTLLVSGNQLGAVSSSAFTITAGGTFTGRVIHAVTSAGVAGALVWLHNGTQSLSTSTSASGDWSVSGLSAGTFTVDASKTGFVSTSVASQVLTPPSTVVENIPLVPTATPGGVFGSIRNATTAALITTSTVVEARLGMNAVTGPLVASQQTSTGMYALANLPAGVYTLVAHNPAYTDGSRTAVAVGGGPATTGPDLVLNPLSGGVAARVVLSWGVAPSDLDSHLTGPITGSAGRFWIYYNSKGNCASSPFACLDVDDTNGAGPETMSIGQVTPGVYRYYVYDFSNRSSTTSTALGSSGAKVEFYVGGALVRSFFVPGGVGNAWAVFEWNGSTVTVLNQLYTVAGTPQPAAVHEGAPSERVPEELLQFLRLPAKPPR